jgi:exosortase A
MKRGAELFPGEAQAQSTWLRAPVLAVGLAVLAILLLYWPTATSIVVIWWRSETFAHGFVVLPICLWLTWRQRDALASIPAEPWWPGLALACLAGAMWFVTSIADVLGLKQFALAFMIQAAIVTVVGTRVARALAFPLAFMLFAIPFGEFLVPTLMDWTADFTVSALRWSGVPVLREANHFTIPSGSWSVVEACSGIRYIIASLMVGTIYAAVAYRSALRRTLFIVASIIVPIVANWLRAYLIVMIAHLSNNRFAVGIDHLIYGWVFFGLVMVLLFWLGSFWQQDAVPTSPAGESGTRIVGSFAGSPPSRRPLFAAALASALVAGIWIPVPGLIDQTPTGSGAVLSKVAGGADWAPSAENVVNWKPRYKGFVSELQQSFRKDGRVVGLYIAYYRNQEKGQELITSGNLLVAPEDWAWKQIATGTDRVEWLGRSVSVDKAEILGSRARIEVFRLYWVDGRMTDSPYLAKAYLAWSKLSGRGDDSALVVMFTPILAPGEGAQATLRAFASAMSPSVERTLAASRTQ